MSLSFLDEFRPIIDEALNSVMPAVESRPTRLHEAMRYSVFAGGKRVRPALTLLATEALGGARDDALPGAASLELIHTFSLIHDDLPALDNDDLRRGRPTVHKQYDEALAILAGDALLNLGLEVLATQPESVDETRRARATGLVAAAVGTFGMIGGQVLDIENEGQSPEDPAATLLEIHRKKTGALLQVSLRVGGVYAGASSGQDQLLIDLGHDLGLLFQIRDDILDVESTSEELGKTAGKDEAVDKLTYPRVFGLDRSRELLNDAAERCRQRIVELPAKREEFDQLVSFLVERRS